MFDVRLLLVVLVLLIAAPAAWCAPGARESVRLERAASYVAGKHVTVNCEPLGEFSGLTVPGSSLIRIEATYCAELERWLRGIPVSTSRLAVDILTLVHESIHARGQADEGRADCEAFRRVKSIAARFFGIREFVRSQNFMREVSAWRAGSDEEYRTIC